MLSAALYIHIPWCVKKCPYCDFNSHKSPENLDELRYIEHLIADFAADIKRFGQRTISSIFIGGGTPSLLTANAYEHIFTDLRHINPFDDDIEITMEANPGTAEQSRFVAYRQVGINRLSLGIQSFDGQKLRSLGRIHDDSQAHKAIQMARNAGFDNLNIDIMHSLPQQSIAEGLADLQTAIEYQPEHLSWYQLTLEPNTVFYTKPPMLPDEDSAAELEQQGHALLKTHNYQRYEISAFCRDDKHSQHNRNYWRFGDYFGIGAGAHGKLTLPEQKRIVRTQKKRQPNDYGKTIGEYALALKVLDDNAIRFEYMLNCTRLEEPIPLDHFRNISGKPMALLLPFIQEAEQQGFISCQGPHWQVTALGRRFTNNLQALFL